MTISPVDFASILCSRLCHDLLSPVGALNNGLELLADETDPAMRERCMELMTESARTSASKLKFFRLAFGSAGGFGEAIDARDARAAIEGLHADGGRVAIDWLVEEERLSKTAAKLLLNLALIAGDALVRGGRLAVGAEEQGGRVEIVIQAEGSRLILPPEIKAMLIDGADETGVTPRTAAAYLVHATAAAAGGSVQVSMPSDNMLLFGVAIAGA